MNEKTTIRKQVLVEAGIECDWTPTGFDVRLREKYRGESYEEAFAALCEERAEVFNDFIRDHRSQDDIRLSVHRRYADLCAHCGREWEPDHTDGVTTCAYCGRELEQVAEAEVSK